MRLLLDTHIWLWSLLEAKKLSPQVATALGENKNELWLSPISVWEFFLLVQKRRLILDRSADDWLSEALQKAPLREAPVTFDIARESRRLDLPHQDPADRFLAATATVLGLTLVTADHRFKQAGDFRIMFNS